MKKVHIENLEPGMILAKPVQNFHNILLLKDQSEITHKSIQMLKSWGILSVWVSVTPLILYILGSPVVQEHKPQRTITSKKIIRNAASIFESFVM